MSIFRKVDFYKDMVQIGLGRGVDVVEKVHLTISDFVIGRGEVVGAISDEVRTVREQHNRHVTDSYQLVRDLNSQVGTSISELITSLESSKSVVAMVDEMYGSKSA
ncbi:hypothetical protein A9Q99_16660 [Gammaproteobacteria bacterium 45_16_T64]|nr:hypothetical protein A9Q99_16660 [Gammaproteobacteria bacterium 45_16_T64]